MQVQNKNNILQLYRNLLRASRQFQTYNYREYAKRRTTDAFRKGSSITSQTEIESAINDAKMNLDIIKRQAWINSQYNSSKSVLELQLQMDHDHKLDQIRQSLSK